MGSRKARTDRNAGPWTSLIGVGVTLIVVLMLAMLFCTLRTHAHEWYPSNCCAETHCRPVECSTITRLPNGSYRFQEGNIDVTYEAIHHQWSPDGGCHVCYGVSSTMTPMPFCIFTPMPAPA